MKEYYPIMLDISNQIIKVVGGGKVAERKVESLLSYGAKVEVISPEITPKLLKYAEDGTINLKKRKYRYGDLEGSFLAYAATENLETQKKCKKECEEKNILLNSVNMPHIGDFIVPSTIKRGSLTISISTNGKSPGLSKKIREELEKSFPKGYSQYIEILGSLREEIKKDIPNIEIRKRIFHELVYSNEVERMIKAQDIHMEEKLYEIYRQAYIHILEEVK